MIIRTTITKKAEQELTAKQIFMQYVLPNKLLWYIAIANVFVYLLRYGIPRLVTDLSERG